MNIFFDEHVVLLKTLLKHKVEFLLIGGYAVIHYGYRRTTGDLDLWIKPDNSSKEKAIQALFELGYDKEDLNTLNEVDFSKHLSFSLGEEPQKVDFLTYINMVSWEEAWKEKVYLTLDDIQIPVLHINHLILSKINNNRLKDSLDIEELQKIKKDSR